MIQNDVEENFDVVWKLLWINVCFWLKVSKSSVLEMSWVFIGTDFFYRCTGKKHVQNKVYKLTDTLFSKLPFLLLVFIDDKLSYIIA